MLPPGAAVAVWLGAAPARRGSLKEMNIQNTGATCVAAAWWRRHSALLPPRARPPETAFELAFLARCDLCGEGGRPTLLGLMPGEAPPPHRLLASVFQLSTPRFSCTAVAAAGGIPRTCNHETTRAGKKKGMAAVRGQVLQDQENS